VCNTMTKRQIFHWIRLSLSLAFSLNSGSVEAASQAPQKLFLSIGIGEYQDSRWPKLKFSGKDAVDMGSALRPSFENGVVLSDSTRQEPIKRVEVLQALKELAAKNASEDDTVIVHISTHGTLAQSVVDGRRTISKFLVMGDTQYDRVANTGLHVPELLKTFQALKSRRKALIIDACYSGQGKAHLTPAMLEFIAKQKAGTLQPPAEDLDESTAVYAASAWGEEAQEDPKLQNGVYTYFLLKSFQDDLNGDGAVQLSEAHSQASSRVIDYTKGAQHPSAQVEIVGQDPVLVSGKLRQPGQPMLMAWRHDLRNFLVSFNGKALGNLGKGALSLPEGTGRLELFDPDMKRLVRSSKVEFRANETYVLESFLAEDRPHHLRLHAGWSLFPHRDAQQEISRKSLAYQAFSYQYDNALSWADLGLAVAMLSPSSSSVIIQGTRVGEPIGLTEVRQTLTGYRVDLKWMWNQRLRLLEAKNQRWQTHWLTAFGPSYIELERSITSYAFRDRSRSVGVQVEQGLEVHWKFRQLSWQVLAQYGLFGNQWTGSQEPVALVSFSSGVGMAL